MKILVINVALFLYICAAAISEAQNAEVGSDELNLIIDSFGRAGFETQSPSAQADRQMPASDYNKLVDESFRRAGLIATVQAARCPQDAVSSGKKTPC